ncbi:MAG: large subunit ribosomal protein [Chloroflexota bacterium]|nr:large subunit ribosomal protein [Chloroflexota bacterium]
MKLHDLHPAAGARKARTRVGRGIAAGQGKTAGRGTKGQRSRAGGKIPAWFEGGQTPIHIRVPKLHGFKNKFRVEYAVVNVGQISAYAEAGRLGDTKPPTVNAETLAQAGLIRGDGRPLKVLGQGDVATKLFVAADSFSASAKTKIEAAGGHIQVIAPEVSAKQAADIAADEVRKAKRAAKPEAEAGKPKSEAQAPESKAQAAESETASSESAESEPSAAGSDSSESAAAES